MPDAFHFGGPQRALLGLRHAPPLRPRQAMLVCAPLLQDGIRCQRALWSLSEQLAATGVEVLRFDWFGSGDSAGDSVDMSMPGLLRDVETAAAWLRASAAPPRLFALRSAALPLLAYAGTRTEPVDLTLWSPQLDGRALVAGWREQHEWQLHRAGRFLSARTSSAADELLGFVLDPALPDALAQLNGAELPLPAGSRLRLVRWADEAGDGAFAAAQRAAGVTVERVQLDVADMPDWNDPAAFDLQIFPRQAVGRLARELAEAA